MFLVTHAAIGAIIGERVANPIVVAALSFVFHFIADIIPHGDSNLYASYKKKKNVKKAVTYVMVDAIATIFFVLLLFNARNFSHPANVSIGIAFGVLPDLLIGIFETGKAKWLGKFHGIHFYFHNLITSRKSDFSFQTGFAMQIILLILLQLRVF